VPTKELFVLLCRHLHSGSALAIGSFEYRG